MTEVTKENKTKGDKSRVVCIKCKTETNHIVLQSVDIDGKESLGEINNGLEISINRFDHYQIIQCLGCEFISFRHINYFSEFQNGDDDGITELIYPKRTINMLDIKDIKNLPNIISKLYEVMIEMYNNEYYSECAEGLRKIVEAICINKYIKGGNVEYSKNGEKKISRSENLKGKIEGLVEKNILTKDSADLLHIHRKLGNDALHDEMKQAKKEDLRIAIEIIENVLISLYDLPEKAKNLIESC